MRHLFTAWNMMWWIKRANYQIRPENMTINENRILVRKNSLKSYFGWFLRHLNKCFANLSTRISWRPSYGHLWVWSSGSNIFSVMGVERSAQFAFWNIFKNSHKWRNLEKPKMNQSKAICEWANQCSYHKKIALVEPFRQSQQIDLSRDIESYQFSRIFSIFKNNVFVTE